MGNYMFLADHNFCHLNTAISSSSEHYSEEEVVVFDDHKLISREQEGHKSCSRGTIINVQLFPKDQQVSDLSFKDPVAAFIESYILENLKVSDFFSLHMFPGEYSFLKEFLSLLLHFRYHLLINDKDKFYSVLKLLGWLLWKSVFT